MFELLGGIKAEEQDPAVKQEAEKESTEEVGIKIDDLSYVLLVINGSKMPEREVEIPYKADA